ncbi:MAG TPA: hypothetical protein VL096_03145 [Pirellulaceae bacterium]|nr:hypothetical protein [Pirellulaceae bacterium]
MFVRQTLLTLAGLLWALLGPLTVLPPEKVSQAESQLSRQADSSPACPKLDSIKLPRLNPLLPRSDTGLVSRTWLEISRQWLITSAGEIIGAVADSQSLQAKCVRLQI